MISFFNYNYCYYYSTFRDRRDKLLERSVQLQTGLYTDRLCLCVVFLAERLLVSYSPYCSHSQSQEPQQVSFLF